MSNQSATAIVAHLSLFYHLTDDSEDAPDYAGVDALGLLLQACADLDCIDGLHGPDARPICRNCGEVLPWLDTRCLAARQRR